MTSHERNQESMTSQPLSSRRHPSPSARGKQDNRHARQPYRSHEPPRPSVSMVAGRGAGRYGYESSWVAKSEPVSKQAAERWDEMKIDKKIAPARAPEEPIHGGIRRERLGQQKHRKAARTKQHVPRNKERRKQHPGTSINIHATPEVINREKDTPHNQHTPPPSLTQASREQQANRSASRTA